jgi:hypothetical protein
MNRENAMKTNDKIRSHLNIELPHPANDTTPPNDFDDVVERVAAANDTKLQDDFDDLVMRSSQGDRRAIGAIAIALGPSLLWEARAVLKELDDEAEDVLQDFLVFLLEQRVPFNRANGRALEWMHKLVRSIARQRRKEARQRYGLDDDDAE